MLFSLIVILLIFFVAVLFEDLKVEKNSENETVLTDPKFDILNPSFTINTEKSKILVTANKGNFLSDDLILLQKNVYFESSNFKIFSEEATFNKKKQIANSKSKSRFKSKGTEIIAEGFSIIQQGDIILFNGKTSLILTQ